MQKFVEEALSDSTCKNLSYTEDFKPWKRPQRKYPDKDGRFVIVLPVS